MAAHNADGAIVEYRERYESIYGSLCMVENAQSPAQRNQPRTECNIILFYTYQFDATKAAVAIALPLSDMPSAL